MKFLLLLSVFLLGTGIRTLGQDSIAPALITLDLAIDLTLSNNKSLKIQQNLVDVAQNNVFLGNSGQLPRVGFSASGITGQSQANIDIRTFQENPPLINIDESGVQSTTLSAGVRAEYVLLGGLRGKYTYKLLQDQNSLELLNQEMLINELTLSVSSLYLSLAKLQAREELLEENVKISQDQLKRIEDQFAFGQSTGSLVLAAQSDINQELNFLDEVRLQKNNLIKELNLLMGIAPESVYQVAVVFQNPPVFDLAELKTGVSTQNPALKAARILTSMSRNQLKIVESARYPQVSAFADYGYYRQENDAQQLAKLQTLGYTGGLSVNLMLFDGKRISQGVKNAKIEIENAEVNYDYSEEKLIKDAVKAHSELILLAAKLERQQKDLSTFEDFFARTQERFDRGLASSLDLRESQRSLLDAKIRIVDAKIQILETEATIKYLTGITLSQLIQ